MSVPPLVLQSERSECGLACLAMVLGHYAPQWDITALRQQFQLGQRGASLQQLLQFAQSLGFVGRGVKLELSHLRELKQPAVLHWDLDHFVVLVRVRRRGLIIHDPAVGRRLVPWAEVNTSFTGVALELWPGPDVDAAPDAPAGLNFARMWQMVRSGRQNMGWVVLLSFVLQALLLMGPWHVQWLVDDALLAGDLGLVHVLALAFAALLSLRVAVSWLRSLVVIHLGHSLSYLFACQLLDHLLHLPLDWYGRRNTGDIAARFASLQPIRDFLTNGAAVLLVDGFIVLVSLLAMLIYAWWLALIVLLVQLLLSAAQLACVGRIKRFNLGLLVAQGAEQSHIIESIKTVQSVKVYAQESPRLERWQLLHARTIDQSMRLQTTQAALQSLVQLGTGAELVAVVTLAGLAILDEQALTVGMLFALLSYRGHFTDRLRSAVEQWVALRTLQVHLKRLSDVWDTEPEPRLRQLQSHSVGVMTLDNVSYRHSPQDPYLFRDLNLRIEAGEFVAIVGASGVGKTTLLRLLMGLMQPSDGWVAVDGQPLRGERALLHRRGCGCVLQEDGYFSGSILENLALFEAADEGRAAQVLEQVGLRSLIAQLPMGVRTTLGDIDSQFSSGQMQRLMLARALYRRPDFLFLDEGTANLDRASARVIEGLVRAMTCTRVIVTHDLGFARMADRVLELRDQQLFAVELKGEGLLGTPERQLELQ